MKRFALVAVVVIALAGVQPGFAGEPPNGTPRNGMPANGLPNNGVPINGLPVNGVPVNGAPLTVTLVVSPQHYSGPCPVTVKFTGSISGKPLTGISYVFVHTLGKTTTKSASIGVAIPASGTLGPFFNALVIDAAHAGPQTNELDVAPGPNKAIVTFSVACTPPGPPHATLLNPSVITSVVTSAPPSALRGHAQTYLPPQLPAPTSLVNTTDPNVCENHFAPGMPFVAQICGAAIHAPYLVLVWSWSPACSNCLQADGYNVYRVDHGHHDYLGNQTPNTSTEYGPALPSDGYGGKCYAVRAFAGKQESADSVAWCLNGTLSSGTNTVVLKPQYTMVSEHHTSHDSGVCNSTHSEVTSQLGSGFTEVGWEYYENDDFPCNHHTSYFRRAAAKFDFSSLASTKLWKVTLNVSPYSSQLYGKIPLGQPTVWQFYNNRYSCIDHLGTGTTSWWTTTNQWLNIDEFESWPLYAMPASVDVTSTVRSWLLGAPNYGFVFEGDKEGDQNDLNWQEACVTFPHYVSLTVEYFP